MFLTSELVYALWEEVPKLVYYHLICKPVIHQLPMPLNNSNSPLSFIFLTDSQRKSYNLVIVSQLRSPIIDVELTYQLCHKQINLQASSLNIYDSDFRNVGDYHRITSCRRRTIRIQGDFGLLIQNFRAISTCYNS